MEAPASGFGEVDPDLEEDFSSVLAPRARRSGADPEAPAAQKAPQPRKKAARRPAAPSRARTTAAEANPVPQEAAESVEASSQARRRGGRPALPPSESSGKLILSASTPIRQRLRAVRNATERVYRDQVLDALEATVDDLPELIERLNRPVVATGRLFDRDVAPKPATGETKQLTIAGFTASQLEVIDHLVQSTGATGRNQLVIAALDEHLPPL